MADIWDNIASQLESSRQTARGKARQSKQGAVEGAVSSNPIEYTGVQKQRPIEKGEAESLGALGEGYRRLGMLKGMISQHPGVVGFPSVLSIDPSNYIREYSKKRLPFGIRYPGTNADTEKYGSEFVDYRNVLDQLIKGNPSTFEHLMKEEEIPNFSWSKDAADYTLGSKQRKVGANLASMINSLHGSGVKHTQTVDPLSIPLVARAYRDYYDSLGSSGVPADRPKHPPFMDEEQKRTFNEKILPSLMDKEAGVGTKVAGPVRETPQPRPDIDALREEWDRVMSESESPMSIGDAAKMMLDMRKKQR